ncbi:MAG TPA: alpha/beta fold hydrolase [Ktedonobacteraceae bacterium]|nr:alpha/beta fold hydrolase [Ktedonobacteraceae bacterium]
MKVSLNDTQIAYSDHGIGLPVIFLHAFPLNRSMWDGDRAALLDEQRYRLVSLDWRGFGESDIPGEISTMEILAGDVVALMDHLGIEQAVLCGLSMGGYVAFACLRQYAQRIVGLILADTRPTDDPPDRQANRENVARIAETQGTAPIADLQLPNLISDYTRQHNPLVETRVRQMINAATRPGIAAASRGMARRADSSDLLAGISCPTLVIVGEQDALIPPSEVQAYAERIPGAQFVRIPNAGHLSNLEQPDIFLASISSFLRSI